MKNNFAANLKYIRENRKISQQELADKIGVDRSTIGYWESQKADPSMLNVCKLSDILDISLIDLIGKDMVNEDGYTLEKPKEEIFKIPLLGTIKGGNPIFAEENIMGYVDIPKDWIKGGKEFYALIVEGNSMAPMYKPKDVVVFEKTEDMEYASGKDCAVMVNSDDVTFKRFHLKDNGITLTPLNLENQDGYLPKFYEASEVIDLPVRVIGIARRVISDIHYTNFE